MWTMKLFTFLLFSLMIKSYGKTNNCFGEFWKPVGRCDGNQTGNSLPVHLQLSESANQRVLTWVVYIYLYEVLGIQNIRMREIQSQFNTTYHLDMMRNDTITIDMEAWIPSELLRIVEQSKALHVVRHWGVGYIFWFGRVGSFDSYHWVKFTKSTSHRIYLGAENIIDQFRINTTGALKNWDPQWGPRGLFNPKRCGENGTRCTIMITGDFLVGDVIEYIEKHTLYIRVYIVGVHLETLTTWLVQTYSDMFFIVRDWCYGGLSYSDKFSQIDTESHDTFHLRTLIPARLRYLDSMVFQVIDRTSFDPFVDYGRSKSEASEYNSACDWLKENGRYSVWWTQGYSIELLIAVIVPSDTSVLDTDSLPKVIELFQKTSHVMEILGKYHITFKLIKYDECKSEVFDHYKYPRLIGIIGIPCFRIHRYEDIRTNDWQLEGPVVVTYDHRLLSVSKTADEHEYVVRTIKNCTIDVHIFMDFMRTFTWQRTGIIIPNSSDFKDFLEQCERLLDGREIELVKVIRIPDNGSIEVIKRMIFDLVKRKVKIISLIGFEDSIFTVLCAASLLDITARNGYVWFLPGYFRRNWWKQDVQKNNGSFGCTHEDYLKVIDGHFSIGPVYFGPNDQIIHGNVTVADWRENFQKFAPQIDLGYMAGFLYDACLTFVNAIRRLQVETGTDLMTYMREYRIQKFRKEIALSDFYGLSGRIRFDDSRTRIMDYAVRQFINNEYQTVAEFNGTLYVDKSAIQWVSNSIPTDGSEEKLQCIFESLVKALDVTCSTSIVIVSVLALVSSSILFFIAFFVFKWKYDRRIWLQSRMIRSQEISCADGPDSNNWKIPWNKIMIKRKIGKGAFGEVYSGEALLEHSAWVPVAVKILKPGSSIENQNDFLNEVQAMKRFDHSNIVKLLGIYNKSGSVRLVMEFMVHGDLKTYLLNRRHLRKELRLTRMALDVSKALTYLSELKYVHRDIACRNCLVNAEGIVKLSDFGLSRSLHEKNYYRLNHRGMFPIRWMAPESLTTGLFTSASDIWSFGILLYEIITFGKTPYDEIRDEDMMKHLKNGNTLSIPEDVNPTLRKLISSCWMMDRTKRPTAVEITDVLSSNSSLLESNS